MTAGVSQSIWSGWAPRKLGRGWSSMSFSLAQGITGQKALPNSLIYCVLLQMACHPLDACSPSLLCTPFSLLSAPSCVWPPLLDPILAFGSIPFGTHSCIPFPSSSSLRACPLLQQLWILLNSHTLPICILGQCCPPRLLPLVCGSGFLFILKFIAHPSLWPDSGLVMIIE